MPMVQRNWVVFWIIPCMVVIAAGVAAAFINGDRVEWVIEKPGVIRYRATNWRVERTKDCCTAFVITQNKLVVEGCRELWACESRATALIGERRALGEEQ